MLGAENHKAFKDPTPSINCVVIGANAWLTHDRKRLCILIISEQIDRNLSL
jgi:hypothetical protein